MKKNKWTTVTTALVGVAIAIVTGRMIGSEVTSEVIGAKPDSKTDVAQIVQEAARSINAQTPMMVDSITRLNEVNAEPRGRLNYYYTLMVDGPADQIDTSVIKAVARYGNCIEKPFIRALKAGVVVSHTYSLPDGDHVASFNLQQHHCDAIFATPTFHSKGWTMESTGQKQLDPETEVVPPGTRYGKMGNGIVHRYFPPGAKPNARDANPFGLDHTSRQVPQ